MKEVRPIKGLKPAQRAREPRQGLSENPSNGIVRGLKDVQLGPKVYKPGDLLKKPKGGK